MSAGVRRLLLVALLGFDLRAVILAVPPILPEVRHDLRLSYAAASLLTSLPVVLFGLGAVPGAILANRVGARRAIAGCLAAMAAGALLRLLPPRLPWLFAGTLVLAAGVALAQPSVSAVLRAWFGRGVERGNAVYSASLSLGGLLGASATPALALLLGWPGTFWFWALPVLALLAVWLRLAPASEQVRPARATRAHLLLRSGSAWRSAVLFGAQSLVFYSAVTWLPFRAAAGGTAAVATALLGMTTGGVLPSVALSLLRVRYATSRPFYLGGGLLMLVSGVAVMLAPPAWLWLGALCLGVGGGVLFAGSMALPAVLAESPAAVPDLTAFVLTIGYAAAFSGPLLGGVVVDASGQVRLAFLPGVVAAAAATALGAAGRWQRPA